MEVLCRPAIARAPKSRTTEEAGEVAARAAKGATRRRCALAMLPALAASRSRRSPHRSRCTTRNRSLRASMGSSRGTPCVRRSKHARCRSKLRSTTSYAARPAAAPAAPAPARAASPHRVGHPRDGAGFGRRRRRMRGLRERPELAIAPAARSSGSRSYTRATPACTEAPARAEGLVAIVRQLCALGANPNSEYHLNWHPDFRARRSGPQSAK